MSDEKSNGVITEFEAEVDAVATAAAATERAPADTEVESVDEKIGERNSLGNFIDPALNVETYNRKTRPVSASSRGSITAD